MAEPYDVLIVGGGLIGASLAQALSGLGLSIALVEAAPFYKGPGLGPDDARAIALAYGTRRIFEGLGLWGRLREQVAPIRKVHVSERGRLGMVRLDAASQGLDALGYVVPAGVLGRVLAEAMRERQKVALWCPAALKGFTPHPDLAQVDIQTPQGTQRLQARLVVGAEGGRSALRQLTGIAIDRQDYGASAIASTVTPGRPHEGVAFERFTDTGPLALLPLTADPRGEDRGGERCAVIWTVPRHQADQVLALNDRAFLGLLQERFGGRLGRLTRVGVRQAYPLVLVRAREQVRARLVLIGNAAHALHPVAGQGFNLGLRDVAALAEVLRGAIHAGRDPGDLELLRCYAAWRRRDQAQTIALTDGLARLFCNGFAPLVLTRNLGLLALDLFAPAKQAFARRAMGLSGHLPRLARGLGLSSM
jgi:2-octaprenyl-6-methoxyphenol hydroxylase